MKALKLSVSLVIVILSVILCQDLIVSSAAGQKYKNENAELNHVKYGLFSIERWKRQFAVILADEVNNLDLTGANEQALRKHIETVLNALIDEVDRKVREGHSDSATGRIKQSFIDVFVSLNDIKKGVPDYANIVINEMQKAETKDQLKAALISKIDQYFKKTYGTKNKARIKSILLRTDRDIEQARTRLKKEIAENHDRVFKEAMLLILLSVFHFSLSGFSRRPLSPAGFLFLVATLAVLLIAGVTTPMIDIEAKIGELSFVLVGHRVHFENQVLYFQSKSILDVFRVLIEHKDVLMKFVGVLVITFSVFFPLLKIVSSFAYYFNYHRARENRLVRFFVLKSGKWSMADVMVVALFMTYIGFNGVIANQLKQLKEAGPQLELITTNGTVLQPGYYLFLAYVLLGLFLTGFLTRKPRPGGPEKPQAGTSLQPVT